MNEISFHGVHQPNSVDMPYRKLMCAMIHQAVNHALGRELSDILDQNDPNFNRRRGEERAAALDYLLSDHFMLDAELLGIDHRVEEIRRMVTRGTYQMPIFRSITEDDRDNIRKEYSPRKVTQDMLAEKYGVSQQRIGVILASV